MRLYRVSSPQEVRQAIRDNFSALPAEVIDLEQAGGRVCAEDIIAPEDVPGFNRSTVDGYAVRAAETFGAGDTIPAMLKLTGEVRMGEAAPALPPGSCVYVPTGGMLPGGADAVVMLEDTETLDDLVNVFRQAAPGENVIRRGEDIAAGTVVIEKGRLLRAPEIGVLASLGITSLGVIRRPLVGILSTGDEIVPYETKVLAPGQVRDSNAPALGEIARRKGARILYGGILNDTQPVFREGIKTLLEQVDFLVLSGGSSVGTRDFTAQTLQELAGGELLVEGVSIQPGKPTLLARCLGKPVLGLPGHPVSAINIFSLFGVYVIERLSGYREESYQPVVRARLSRNIPSRAGRTDYVRVKLEQKNGMVYAVPVLGRSGLLRTLADAHGMVAVPPESEGVQAGKDVDVIIWE
ncbi:MAG: molybdopterin molybdotransferase MoeA [Peptococcaceae bacterium]|nr:molybdopterin molybdotransferase MoeA [Peptococcaceae bacterium]MDH7524410.1 molybdopterin molybdotransferase MoeA [Peptococcaceae bacterium]